MLILGSDFQNRAQAMFVTEHSATFLPYSSAAESSEKKMSIGPEDKVEKFLRNVNINLQGVTTQKIRSRVVLIYVNELGKISTYKFQDHILKA